MSQLLTSLLTVIGVLAMMIYISPVLALVALITVPVSMYITLTIGEALQAAVRRPVVDDERPSSTVTLRRPIPAMSW